MLDAGALPEAVRGKIGQYKSHEKSGGLAASRRQLPVFDVFRENVLVIADSTTATR